MELIFGGAYQGKLDYAKALLGNKEDFAIYTCPDIRNAASPEECIEALDPARAIAKLKPVPIIIDHLERMVYALVDAGLDPVEYVQKNLEALCGIGVTSTENEGINAKSRILIIEDISQGIVPIDTKERAWREANGRVMALLAKEATSVTRVFCGIPQQLK
ncbi:MAG: bifunctional adenosylcobinamide kinase/adenosylcobinamide-phosphate guanylyltransferase [Firmicutes bacterium]|nr:bifunctional adenosylcobinamide kinase/adenosylcobinamide-phosphate guanylyltransferase [Bacillota bacterium]